ncbi:hypothetical protein [Pararhizobium sp. A13]|uniref:hypothetical protein n=1 Tax=Pararhizobium sp. A13 TaxID=3133975 RepID=UPI00324D4003
MSDSNRGQFFKVATAVVIITLLCLSAIAVFETGSSTALSRSKQQSNSTNYIENADQEIKQRCALRDSYAMSECIRGVIEATNEHERAENDLVAQSDMAWWTFWMTVVSAATLGITSIGIYYIRDTLVETRKAVKAADDAVIVTRDMAQMQMRAYMNTAHAWISFKENNEPVAHVSIKNFGQTPAMNVKSWIHIWIEKYPLKGSLPFPKEGEVDQSSSVISPGFHYNYHHPRTRGIDEEIMTEIRAGRAAIYVYGGITYDDVFGGNRKTEFLKFCTGERGGDDENLKDYRNGNYAT